MFSEFYQFFSELQFWHLSHFRTNTLQLLARQCTSIYVFLNASVFVGTIYNILPYRCHIMTIKIKHHNLLQNQLITFLDSIYQIQAERFIDKV